MTTVKELIKALEKLDPETIILTTGYEGGFEYATLPSKKSIKLFKDGVNDEWYYGNIDEAGKDDEDAFKGVVI